MAVVLVIITTALALAAPPLRYADSFEGPVKHLLTPEEVTRWQSVASDEEAQAFIDLFWAKRDPTPATPRNEFREEFDKRVSLADEHFTTKRTRGALSDRGRTMILLGSPFLVGNKGPARGATRNAPINSAAQWDGSVQGPRGASAMLSWTYAADKKPAFIKRKDLEILFIDDAGDGQWQFAVTPRTNPEAVLLEAARALIVSPNLAKAPSFEDVASGPATASLRTSALKKAYEQFRADEKTTVGPALLTWGQFVTPDGEIFVPVQLFVPGGSGIEAGRKLTFFGVVENAVGTVVQAYEEPVTLNASLRDAYVDKSLILRPGRYRATVGLADKDQVLALATTEMTVDKLDPSESAMSDMILSNNTFALPVAQLITDPFAFGGLKVVPKGDASFSQKDDIWYFFELRNPGVADSGAPKIQAKIEIEGKTAQEKPVKWALPWQEIETLPLKGVKNHYVLGMSFPLKDFVPGRYTVKIRVLDATLKKTYESEKEFQVTF
jgi:GWxTD domain-containing protein